MSFSLSVSGHIVKAVEAEARQLEQELVDDLRALFSKSKYAEHVQSGSFSGQHIGSQTVAPVPPVPVVTEAPVVEAPTESAPVASEEAPQAEAGVVAQDATSPQAPAESSTPVDTSVIPTT